MTLFQFRTGLKSYKLHFLRYKVQVIHQICYVAKQNKDQYQHFDRPPRKNIFIVDNRSNVNWTPSLVNVLCAWRD